MNRTKLAALLASLALTLFAFGCGGDSSNANHSNTANANAANSNAGTHK